MTQKLALTVAEVAERLSCSEDSVRRRVRAGELPTLPRRAKKSQMLIPVRALEQYVERACQVAAS